MAIQQLKKDDGLNFPKHLLRKLSKKDAEARGRIVDRLINVGAREWVPIRKKGEWSERPTMPLLTNDPHLPVRVQVKGKEAGSVLLATYANMEEFEKKHNKATYPVKGQPVTLDGTTIILVTAKPWAGKENIVKREGPKKSAVKVGGKPYDSVPKAFAALKLPTGKMQVFRKELKAKKKLTFEHDGKKYNFAVAA
jgi:hypothetical protein